VQEAYIFPMWEQFWIQNINYVIQVFIAFWMITACWIYLDGWFLERKAKTFLRSLGFFILTIWAFLGAIPFSTLSAEQFALVERLLNISGILGFGLILLSLLIDPIPVKPNTKPVDFFFEVSETWKKFLSKIRNKNQKVAPPPPLSQEIAGTTSKGLSFFLTIAQKGKILLKKIKEKKKFPPGGVAAIGMFGTLSNVSGNIRSMAENIFLFLFPIAIIFLKILIEPKLWMLIFSIIITILLWLHYIRGIQSEWKYFYRGFLWISIALALSLTSLWQDSSNVAVRELLAPFHAVWILEHLLKLVGAVLLGVWAWGFIRFRLFPQILSSFVAFTFIIFMSTTIIYTGFLLKRMQDDAVISMATNIKTVDFALSKVKDSAVLAARIASINPQLKEAVRRDDKDALYQNLNALVFENETDFMLVVNTGGEILMRAEDRERYGDSIADDPIVWRALDGKAVVTTVATQGVTVPTVSIRAASPIVDTSEAGDPEIIGAVITGFLLDTAFVDGMKKITGLEITIFSDNIRSATTLVIPESQFRLIGTQEVNEEILDTVLRRGESFTGTTKVINQSFLAAYIPIKDVEETEIGMFFTGRSHASILAAAGETMQLTFVVSILLMIVALFALWWTARFIAYHQKI